MRNYNIFFYLVALLSCLCFVSADEDEERDESKKGLAFGLVIAAGMSTTIGAAFVFCDAAVKRENYKFLGGALGFAGGIMIYIALVEILQGSFGEFTEVFEDEEEEETAGRRLDGGDENATALTLGTLMFFVGVLIIYLLDFIVHRIFKAAGSPLQSHAIITDARNSIKEAQEGEEDAEAAEDKENDDQTEEVSEALRIHLRKMGIVTAIALGLHNLPEGFATYVGALKDTELGVSLAFAIAIHNIPEGLCVAIPIFYATGSRWQGFWVAFASGLAEIVGGIIAEIAVGDEDPATFGVVFGIVAGMMTCIVLRELMPTALRYDPHDKYVTNCLFIGAAVMAFSIILFNI